jgi:hypothetical protein
MKRMIAPFKCKGKDFAEILAEKIKELEKKETEKSRSACRRKSD